MRPGKVSAKKIGSQLLGKGQSTGGDADLIFKKTRARLCFNGIHQTLVDGRDPYTKLKKWWHGETSLPLANAP